MVHTNTIPSILKRQGSEEVTKVHYGSKLDKLNLDIELGTN